MTRCWYWVCCLVKLTKASKIKLLISTNGEGQERLLRQQAGNGRARHSRDPPAWAPSVVAVLTRSWDNSVAADRRLFSSLTEVVSKHKQEQEQQRGEGECGEEQKGLAAHNCAPDIIILWRTVIQIYTVSFKAQSGVIQWSTSLY